MTKPRVLLSGHIPPPIGGIGTYCQTLLGSNLSDGVNLRFVQTSSQRRSLLASGSASWRNVLEAIQDMGRFFRACLSHRPHIVHLCTAQGLSFLKNGLMVAPLRFLGCRILLNPHCAFHRLYGGGRFWRWFCRRIFRFSNGVLALSREWLALEAILPGIKVHYLPNAIDIKPYEGIMARRSQASRQGVHLLYLGYLGAAKGTYDLLEAFRLMEIRGVEVVLHLVGDFLSVQDEKRLKALKPGYAGPGKTLSLEAPVYGEAKLARFEQADVFVLPSHNEGMPMAILEAMASGLPIVATTVGGIPDLITDGANGLLTAPREPRDLAVSLERLCADPVLRSDYGSRNAESSRDFHIQRYAQNLLRIYARVYPQDQ